ncbi:MAG: heat shock protein transcriptional repressor HspR [Angustibacter sp.]
MSAATPDRSAELDDNSPIFVISVAAELAGMHPQTLRQYDRIGLGSPVRTQGGGRRYSARDIAALRDIQQLSQEGVSLLGIKRILELQAEVTGLRERVLELETQVSRAELMTRSLRRIFAAGPTGEVISVVPGRRSRESPPTSSPSGTELVIWRPELDE